MCRTCSEGVVSRAVQPVIQIVELSKTYDLGEIKIEALRRVSFTIARGEACEAASAVEIAAIAGDCTRESAARANQFAVRLVGLLTGLIRRGVNPKPEPEDPNPKP